MPRVRDMLMVGALAALFVPGLFAIDMQNAPTANPAVPGTLNYVEGSAALNGAPVNRKAIGSAAVGAGQVLSTAQGRAELLLTPGVYLRLGDNSAAKMVSPDLTETAVALQQGRAAVEADQLFKENNIHILVNNVPVQIVKTGLYEFSAESNTVRVFQGEAAVDRGNGHWTLIKGGHELSLAEGPGMKPVKFDKKAQEQSGLYRWSSLRSDYLAQSNEQIASQYAGYSPGWYWDPYAFDYTFLGAYPFYSPFGFGFYPLGWGYGGWGGGWYGPGYYGGGWGGGRFVGPHGAVNLPRGGFGGGAMRGGGFRGGMGGGFHGGGGMHMAAGGFGGRR